MCKFFSNYVHLFYLNICNLFQCTVDVNACAHAFVTCGPNDLTVRLLQDRSLVHFLFELVRRTNTSISRNVWDLCRKNKLTVRKDRNWTIDRATIFFTWQLKLFYSWMIFLLNKYFTREKRRILRCALWIKGLHKSPLSPHPTYLPPPPPQNLLLSAFSMIPFVACTG